jgi:hypothetical protein
MSPLWQQRQMQIRLWRALLRPGDTQQHAMSNHDSNKAHESSTSFSLASLLLLLLLLLLELLLEEEELLSDSDRALPTSASLPESECCRTQHTTR